MTKKRVFWKSNVAALLVGRWPTSLCALLSTVSLGFFEVNIVYLVFFT